MSTFDEVIKECRGGVKVATRWGREGFIAVTGNQFTYVGSAVGIANWAPSNDREGLFAEDWVVYDNMQAWSEGTASA